MYSQRHKPTLQLSFYIGGKLLKPQRDLAVNLTRVQVFHSQALAAGLGVRSKKKRIEIRSSGLWPSRRVLLGKVRRELSYSLISRLEGLPYQLSGIR